MSRQHWEGKHLSFISRQGMQNENNQETPFPKSADGRRGKVWLYIVCWGWRSPGARTPPWCHHVGEPCGSFSVGWRCTDSMPERHLHICVKRFTLGCLGRLLGNSQVRNNPHVYQREGINRWGNLNELELYKKRWRIQKKKKREVEHKKQVAEAHILWYLHKPENREKWYRVFVRAVFLAPASSPVLRRYQLGVLVFNSILTLPGIKHQAPHTQVFSPTKLLSLQVHLQVLGPQVAYTSVQHGYKPGVPTAHRPVLIIC